MEQKTMIRDLTTGSVGKQLLVFSIPFLLSNALQTVYNLVDMVIVGQFVGSAGLSAVSIGGTITWLLCCLAIGYSTGGQIYLSQQVGSGDYSGMKKTIGTLFTAVFGFAVVLSILGVAFYRPLLQLLNTPEEAMKQASDYVVICSAGMIFVYGYNTVAAVLRGMGDSKRPFYFIALSAVLNIFLDLLFVGPLHMEAGGAALATILAQAVSFIIAIIYLYRNRENFGFDFRLKSFRPDGKTFRILSGLGLPLTVQTSAINLSMMYVSAGINSYGLVYASVYGIGGKLQSLMFIITNSVNNAGATMFGQNLGAGKMDRVKKTFWYCVAICMGFFVMLSLICLVWPQPIFRIFTSDAEVLAEAAYFMVTLVVMFGGFATMNAANALINGIGNGRLSLIIALLDGVVFRIGLCLLLVKCTGLGVWSYFWGNALAGYASTILANGYYFTGLWKKRKLMIEQ